MYHILSRLDVTLVVNKFLLSPKSMREAIPITIDLRFVGSCTFVTALIVIYIYLSICLNIFYGWSISTSNENKLILHALATVVIDYSRYHNQRNKYGLSQASFVRM